MWQTDPLSEGIRREVWHAVWLTPPVERISSDACRSGFNRGYLAHWLGRVWLFLLLYPTRAALRATPIGRASRSPSSAGRAIRVLGASRIPLDRDRREHNCHASYRQMARPERRGTTVRLDPHLPHSGHSSPDYDGPALGRGMCALGGSHPLWHHHNQSWCTSAPGGQYVCSWTSLGARGRDTYRHPLCGRGQYPRGPVRCLGGFRHRLELLVALGWRLRRFWSFRHWND